MIKKFKTYFKQNLVNEAINTQPVPAVPEQDAQIDDGEVFKNSFEDESQAQQIDSEIQNATLEPEQRAQLLRRADKYAEKIADSILPTLRNLHNDITSGMFSSIGLELKDISGINEDLAKLSESLRGRTRDAVLKAGKKDTK